jgi:hypothetical protein
MAAGAATGEPRADVYISADTETDGPIPGERSMLSFGFAVAGTFNGARFEGQDPSAQTFYRELRPISQSWDADALRVSGLDRDRLQVEGEDPGTAMTVAAEWVGEVAGHRRPVLVAYPLGFDWMFLQWYFVRFAEGGSPFGHASCLDIKTIYQQRAWTVLDRTRRDELPPELRPLHPHTHHALDDAIEQAELLANLLAWCGRRRE